MQKVFSVSANVRVHSGVAVGAADEGRRDKGAKANEKRGDRLKHLKVGKDDNIILQG